MAEASYPHIPFLAGNVLTDTILSGHFDLVVSQEVLAHVDDQARYLEVAAEVLRPGGYLILTPANKFVMDPPRASSWGPRPREHIARFLHTRDMKRPPIP